LPVEPLPLRPPPIDEDALKAAAKRLGAAKRPLIVAGGGAIEASAEVTALAHVLQAAVLTYRRGRGVLSDRDPLSVNLPLGHELWAEADVVLSIGTHLHMPLLQWGFDRDLAVIAIDLDPEAPARITFCRPITRGGHRAPRRCAGVTTKCTSAWRSSRRNSATFRRFAPSCPRMAYLSTR
jgi:thiamine pyrophosphate-dependent acetolactate synthase large subunit-like protein